MIQKCDDVHQYSTQSLITDDFNVPGVDLSKAMRTVSYAGSVTWNDLPNDIRKAHFLNHFQVKLRLYA